MGSLIGRDALEDMVPGERAKRTESAGGTATICSRRDPRQIFVRYITVSKLLDNESQGVRVLQK